MNTKRSTIARTLALALMISASPAPLHAQSAAETMLPVLKAMLEYGGYEVGFKDVAFDGDNVTINDLRFRMASLMDLQSADLPFDPSEPFQAPAPVTIEGVGMDEQGNYTASRISMPGFTFEQGDGVLTAGELSYTDIRVPADPDQIDILDLMIMSAGGMFGPFHVTADGVDALDTAAISVTNSFFPSKSRDVERIESTFSLPFATLLVQNAPEGTFEDEFLDYLNGENLTASFEGEFSWTVSDGRLQYKSWRVTADKLGQITFSFDMSGFTPAVLDQIIALSRDLDPEDPEVQAELMQWGMTMLATSQFYSLSVRYDDLGLVASALDEEFGDNSEARIAALNEIMDEAHEFFGAVNDDAFEAETRAAFEEFALNPQSMELRLQPDTPVPAISVVGLAASPKVLFDTIGFELIVNDG